MIETIYEFVTGLQDGYKQRNGWGWPRGHGTIKDRPWYWTGYRAGQKGPQLRPLWGQDR
jgi:hypothetical protein